VRQPAAFLFDLDGTLAHTLPDIAASCNHVRARHGLPPADLAAVCAFVGDGARTLLARALHEVLPVANARREAMLDAAFADYADHHGRQCTVHARLFPGVLPFLQRQRAADTALGVVTNKPERFVRPLLAHLGIHDLFGAVVGGDTLPHRKPSPEPLRAALQQLGVLPQAAVMVGDSVQDLRAGKAAGLATIGCLFGYGEASALRAEGADAWWASFGVAAD